MYITCARVCVELVDGNKIPTTFYLEMGWEDKHVNKNQCSSDGVYTLNNEG